MCKIAKSAKLQKGQKGQKLQKAQKMQKVQKVQKGQNGQKGAKGLAKRARRAGKKNRVERVRRVGRVKRAKKGEKGEMVKSDRIRQIRALKGRKAEAWLHDELRVLITRPTALWKHSGQRRLIKLVGPNALQNRACFGFSCLHGRWCAKCFKSGLLRVTLGQCYKGHVATLWPVVQSLWRSLPSSEEGNKYKKRRGTALQAVLAGRRVLASAVRMRNMAWMGRVRKMSTGCLCFWVDCSWRWCEGKSKGNYPFSSTGCQCQKLRSMHHWVTLSRALSPSRSNACRAGKM